MFAAETIRMFISVVSSNVPVSVCVRACMSSLLRRRYTVYVGGGGVGGCKIKTNILKQKQQIKRTKINTMLEKHLYNNHNKYIK